MVNFIQLNKMWLLKLKGSRNHVKYIEECYLASVIDSTISHQKE